MARVSYQVWSVVLLALATSVRSQFFADIFQGFQPFVTSRPTLKPIYEQTTRTRTNQNRGSYRQTTEATTKSYENYGKIYPPIVENETDRRKTNVNYDFVYTTTVKPRKVKESSRRINSNKRDQATQSDYTFSVKENYDGKINSISYNTEKPYRVTEFDRNNYYTTHNSLINRPGVKPAVVDNRPPITNRPVTKRPNYGTNPRPKDEDSIAFPGEDTSPEIRIGPDEDYMSAVEKKRYIELSERMCDKYKSLTTKAVQAIPLLPSPEPVSLNVTACTPTTVPLVVGGKVVRIQEFPHMALLGWRKLEGAGYSWKCGGSLVSEQFILTAAHCTYQDRDNTVDTGPPTAVQLGSSYLDDPGALVVKVAAVIRHPKYKQPRSYYDLAIVKMVNAVKFSEVIKPACLGVPPAEGKSIVATGWGRTEFGGDQSHELRSVSLPVWGMPRCQEVLGTSRKLPDGPSGDSQVCAGEERGGKDTCQGDSGGPAQLQEGCVWRVVAVTSLGRSCGAAETPGLYARVQRAFVASQVFGGWDSQGKGDTGIRNGQNSQGNGGSGGNYGGSNKDGQNSQGNEGYGGNYGGGNKNGQNNQGNGDIGGNYGGGNKDGQNSQGSEGYGGNYGGGNKNGQNNQGNGAYGDNYGSNSGHNNGQRYGNDNGEKYGNDNGETYGNSNGQSYGNKISQYGNNNGNNNNENYGNNNGYNYGDNENKNYDNQNGNRQKYDDNNQNYGELITERPRLNRPQYTTVRTKNVNYNNGQNKPYNNGYNQDQNNNNNQNYGPESDSNDGNNNRQQSDYNNYNQGSNNKQDSINEYTTRRTTSNRWGTLNSNYSNNNYNTQNTDDNNNRYSNTANNNRRPSESYTISRPWWL